MPRVLGVGGILEEWTAWRTECVRRRVYFILKKKQDKLHLLQGLKRILLDIDKAIRIIRETEEEAEVIPNLMIGFGIDQVQAEYVAEIKLRNINKEYILKRVAGDRDPGRRRSPTWRTPWPDPSASAASSSTSWTDVRKKYAMPRRTEIVYGHELPEEPEEEPVDGLSGAPVPLPREGYFKKITPQSLRMSGEQKYKEGDGPAQHFETTNARRAAVLHRPRSRCYKTRAAASLSDTKASVAGRLPARQAGHGGRRERDLSGAARGLQRLYAVLL